MDHHGTNGYARAGDRPGPQTSARNSKACREGHNNAGIKTPVSFCASGESTIARLNWVVSVVLKVAGRP